MRGKAEDLTGRIFGSLKAVKRLENNKNGQPQWLCECECGNEYVAQARYLKNEQVKSCGCLKKGRKRGEMREREMLYASDSLARLLSENDDTYSLTRGLEPYQNLANAIVCVAADDYREALKRGDTKLLENLTDFFRSDWYQTLTRVKPDRMLSLLNRENAGSLEMAYA